LYTVILFTSDLQNGETCRRLNLSSGTAVYSHQTRWASSAQVIYCMQERLRYLCCVL